MKKSLIGMVILFLALIACNLPGGTPKLVVLPSKTPNIEATLIYSFGTETAEPPITPVVISLYPAISPTVVIISQNDATATAAETWTIIGRMMEGDQLITPAGTFALGKILSFDPADQNGATISYPEKTTVFADNFKFEYKDNYVLVSANGWVQKGGYLFSTQ